VIVVADMSVVLNLCFLRKETLLTKIFGTVLSPPSVRDEFIRLASSDPRFRGLTFPTFIQVAIATQVAPALSTNRRLHRGELDALSLALERLADAILIDERAGRAAAMALNLRSIGILGILMQGKALSLIPAIAPLIDRLQAEAAFWVAPELRRKVLAAVGE
jgi:uncharacterized protein